MAVNPGEVEIELNGRKVTLKPSLQAAKEINFLGGLGGAIGKLASGDLDAYFGIVAAGLSKTRAEIEEDVWASELSDLAKPLSDFVSKLWSKRAARGEKKPGE